MAGPRTGKLNTYSSKQMPIVKEHAPKKMMLNRLAKRLKAIPKPSPNNPVVKGKMTSSLG